MAMEQTRSQLVLAVGIDSRRDENLVTGDAVNRVPSPIDLRVYIFDDNTPATMLGFHGHP
jgi:hypothetical protein